MEPPERSHFAHPGGGFVGKRLSQCRARRFALDPSANRLREAFGRTASLGAIALVLRPPSWRAIALATSRSRRLWRFGTWRVIAFVPPRWSGAARRALLECELVSRPGSTGTRKCDDNRAATLRGCGRATRSARQPKTERAAGRFGGGRDVRDLPRAYRQAVFLCTYCLEQKPDAERSDEHVVGVHDDQSVLPSAAPGL